MLIRSRAPIDNPKSKNANGKRAFNRNVTFARRGYYHICTYDKNNNSVYVMLRVYKEKRSAYVIYIYRMYHVEMIIH